MDIDATDAVADNSQRIAHACQSCREKRVRCSGDRPTCQRCIQQNLECIYGFARGDRRKTLLAALDSHNARSEHPEAETQGDVSPDRPARLTISTKIPEADEPKALSAESDNDLVDGDTVDEDMDDAPSSSLVSPILPRGDDFPASTTKRSSTQKKQRRTRISSACIECKRRRRKCTGEVPCQTCITFSAECTYDRTQDRRSKAYFQKQLNAGVREAVEADNTEGVLKMLHQNEHYDDVSTELQNALNLASESRKSISGSSMDKMSTDRSDGQPDDDFDGHSAAGLAELRSGVAADYHKPNVVAMPDAISDGGHDSAEFRPIGTSLYKRPQLVCKHFCAINRGDTTHQTWIPEERLQKQRVALNGEPYSILPLSIPDESPMSRAFVYFRGAVDHMLQQGMVMSNILGPLELEVDLMFRPRHAGDPFTAGTWACELARVSTQIDVYTRLANAFLLSRFMRWVLDPSAENYLFLPDIMKPTTAQRLIPHFASADMYSLPAVRDSLIRGELQLSGTIGKEDVRGVKFHWPFDMERAIDHDTVTGVSKISRLFVACASDLEYWSCGLDFLENLPETKDHLNIIKHKHDWDQLTML